MFILLEVPDNRDDAACLQVTLVCAPVQAMYYPCSYPTLETLIVRPHRHSPVGSEGSSRQLAHGSHVLQQAIRALADSILDLHAGRLACSTTMSGRVQARSELACEHSSA